MSLDAVIAEVGRVLDDARRLYGAVPSPGEWTSTGDLASARNVVFGAHDQAQQSWQGHGSGTYVAAGGRGVHGLDFVADVDGGTQAGLRGGAAQAGQGRVGVDTVITDTRNGVVALAPSTATPAGRRELITHLQGQLGRAKELLRVSQQRDVALSALIRNAARGYHGAVGTAIPMASAPMGLNGRAGAARMPHLGRGRPARWAQPGLTLAVAQGPGSARVRAAVRKALDLKGIKDPAARARWEAGMMLVAKRESGFRRDAINTNDINAARGDPSRGSFQFIGSTFRAYHEPGTSADQTDDVAQACAFINYAQRHYQVTGDGSNLVTNIQQADPTRPPRGY